MSALIYYDGNYSNARQHGQTVFSTDPVTWASLATRTMHQLGSNFRRQQPGTVYHFNGSTYYLYEETEPHDTGVGGVVEWQRHYSTVPSPRIEPTELAYTYQYILNEGLSTTGFVTGNLAEITVPTFGFVLFTYGFVQPTSVLPIKMSAEITPLFALRLVQVGNTIRSVGTVNPPDAQLILAMDSKPERWRGVIWERRAVYITPRDLQANVR